MASEPEAACVSHPISTATYDAHSVPVPPPPRPPRPVKIPGYVLTAETHKEATQWVEQQVFYTPSRTILQSIRQKQPIFLLDAEAQQLHGVFQRAADAQLVLQDLTTRAGPHGYKVHVAPMYEFAVTLKLSNVEDLLVRQQPSPKQQQGHQPASSSSFEPMLGSFQHGALWEAFMKEAKRQKHMEAIQEEEQSNKQRQEGVLPPPPPPPPPPPAAAVAHGAGAAANGHT